MDTSLALAIVGAFIAIAFVILVFRMRHRIAAFKLFNVGEVTNQRRAGSDVSGVRTENSEDVEYTADGKSTSVSDVTTKGSKGVKIIAKNK